VRRSLRSALGTVMGAKTAVGCIALAAPDKKIVIFQNFTMPETKL
jgi:hypothetical protein